MNSMLMICYVILCVIIVVLIKNLDDAKQELDKHNDTIYSQKVIIDGFKRAYPKEFKDILPK